MAKHELTITGMHCKSCTLLITDALEESGASNISIDLDEKKQIGKASFEYSGAKQSAIQIIEKEGYKVQ